MKIRWKRAFLWSSLGSMAVAVSVAVVRKRRKQRVASVDCVRIPPGKGLSIRTESFASGPDGTARDLYVLQPTAFKVWSVLDLHSDPALPNPEGAPIYHVTHSREGIAGGSEGELVLEKFYATLRCVEPGSSRPRKNRIAASTYLELPRCYVGGASNGIESGEVHRSAAPVQEWTIESPAGDASAHESSP